MLEVRDLVVSYGAVTALRSVSLRVPAGKLVCVIGSNGAGKTTMLRAISGLLRPGSGDVLLEGKSIVADAPHAIARAGVAHVPEGRHVFPDQTVLENLMLGAFPRRSVATKKEYEADLASAFDLFPRLRQREGQYAGTLSGGEQQMLAIGRALMSRPKLLLLDEPSMGLAPALIDEVFRLLGKLKERRIPMLLVEQLAYRALEISDYGYVIEHGAIQLEGDAARLQRDEGVRAAYLGRAASSADASSR